MQITVKSGKTGHHFMKEVNKTYLPHGGTMREEYWGKTRYSESSYCNSHGSSCYDESELLERKDWEDEKICNACALQAYKKGEVKIVKLSTEI